MKAKQIILVLMLSVSLFVRAQDKYEFMIIEYPSQLGLISISIDGVEFKKEKLEKRSASGYDASALLLKVKEYQDKGWEVMSFDTKLAASELFEYYFAYLKRKKTNRDN